MDDMETYKNNRNSIKLDIEAARLAAETIDNKLPKETYKKIIDDFGPIEGECTCVVQKIHCDICDERNVSISYLTNLETQFFTIILALISIPKSMFRDHPSQGITIHFYFRKW